MIEWYLPIKTVSESNSTEHWTKKRRRHQIQQGCVDIMFRSLEKPIELPVRVILIRIAPRSLDSHDNLPVALKWITDALASNLTGIKASGRGDDDERISWEYKQEKGKVREYAVKIEIHNV